MDMNVCCFIGRLGQAPDVKALASGKTVCNVSLAVNGYRKDDVSWVPLTFWEKKAEVLSEYCRKGSRIGVRCHLQTNKGDDGRTFYSFIVDDLFFLDAKGDDKVSQNVERQPDPNPFSDDDVPF
jgi:single-strand DNA-binding protein